MNEALRRSAAHVLVDDVDVPVLAERDVHHLLTVLRLRTGEPVTVTDGYGRWRTCRVAGAGLEPDGDVVSVPAPEAVTVAVAVPKQDRPEWLVQKLTEVGVDRIVLLHAARSVVRWDGGRAGRHLDRLARVAVEAATQARRVWFPQVTGPVDASSVIGAMPLAEPGGTELAPGDAALAIGPEGGWTADELARAPRTVSLGDTVLRVETAALTAGVLLVAARARRRVAGIG